MPLHNVYRFYTPPFIFVHMMLWCLKVVPVTNTNDLIPWKNTSRLACICMLGVSMESVLRPLLFKLSLTIVLCEDAFTWSLSLFQRENSGHILHSTVKPAYKEWDNAQMITIERVTIFSSHWRNVCKDNTSILKEVILTISTLCLVLSL